MKQENNDCIGNLDNRIHGVFANTRLSGEDFVYCPSADLYTKLDDYCDELTFSEVRPPLMIKGDFGTGKSALLSNWIHRRENNTAKNRVNNDEFIFWHAVGCSRQSLNVNNLIRRLLSGLKTRFELSRDLPKSQERLSWELPRFLDLAAKKGKIIIIIDGAHRLKKSDDSDDNLSWLPLSLPPNVRTVLSVTIENKETFIDPRNKGMTKPPEIKLTTSDESEHGKNRIISELERRITPSLLVRSLDLNTCKSIIQEYVKSTVSSETAAVATGPYIGAMLDPKRNPNVHPTSTDTISGFLLFDSQSNILLDHLYGGNPLFLRLFLRCLHFVCSRGYSLWVVFDYWMKAATIEDLYNRILDSCETGFKRSRESSQKDSDSTIAAGGMAALKSIYPWHPTFRNRENHSVIDDSPTTRFNTSNSLKDSMNTNSKVNELSHAESNEESNRVDSKAFTTQVMNNLGDQEWVALERQAHKQLQKAIFETKKSLEESHLPTFHKDRTSFVQEVLNKMNDISNKHSDIHESSFGNNFLRVDSNDGTLSTHSGLILHLDNNYSNSSDDEDSWDDHSHNSENLGELEENEKAKPSSILHPHPLSKKLTSHPSHDSLNKMSTMGKISDPSEGFFSLPIYMRGGTTTSGFGDLLGNALGLLYVARQGLKEHELWKILTHMQKKTKELKEFSPEKKQAQIDKKNMLVFITKSILKERKQLENKFMAEDITVSGFIDIDLLYQCIRKFVDIHIDDYDTLIDFLVLHFDNEPNDNRPLEKKFLLEDKINYRLFFQILIKFLRRKNKLADEYESTVSYDSNSQIDEDFDNFKLAQIQDDEEENIEEDQIADPDQTEGCIETLGPVVEELLLKILCALGVLYSPENKVLILPSESEEFRDTIYKRYIFPRGNGSVIYWHNLIIEYFRTQPNSLRKCEELPWHLKICRKWTSLKNSLVDLKAFDLMLNNDLKDELIEYWLLLSEGPLYIGDIDLSQINKKASIDHEDGNNDSKSSYSNILKEIDQSIALKTSLKDIRTKSQKDQLHPFDVVEEFNKTIEAWVTTERPTPSVLHRTLSQISIFLLEFAKYTHICPQFRRLGVDLSFLEEFGIHFDDLNNYLNNQSSSITLLDEDYTVSNTATPQKPGLLDKPAVVIKHEKHEQKYFDGLQKLEAKKFPPSGIESSKFYLYLRWIWIQFPWLALNFAAKLNGNDTNSDVKELDDVNGETANEATDSNEATKHLLRVWNVKKSDPTIAVFNPSLNRKLAAIKPRTSLSSSLERNVNVTYNKLYDELTQPSFIAQVRLGMGVQNRDKFRKTLEQDIEANRNIPFSYHAKKTLKSGSLFPSFSASLQEINRKKIESDLFLSDAESDSTSLRSNINKKKKKTEKFNLEAALRSGGAPSNDSTFFLTEVDDEIRRITSEEYLHSHRLDSSSSTSIIRDELDLECNALLDRIARMKTIWNKLQIIQHEKEKMIVELENTIMLRQESDVQLINDVQSGEALISSLHERNFAMEKSLKDAKALKQGYEELIKGLKLNPPYIESHVKSLEMEVSLVTKQFDDLCNHRTKLYIEGERVDSIKKQQLIDKIKYYENARLEVNAKKKQVVKENKHLKDSLGGRDTIQRRNRKGRRSSTDNKNLNHAESGDDSDSSKDSNADLHLSQPVKHFLNALVRKVTYNEPIIKDSDKSLDDVKKRTVDKLIPIDNGEIIINPAKSLQSNSVITNASESISTSPTKPKSASDPKSNQNILASERKKTIVLLHPDNNFSSNEQDSLVAGKVSNSSIAFSKLSNNERSQRNSQGNIGNNFQSSQAAYANLSRRRFSIEQLSNLKQSIKSLTGTTGFDTQNNKENFKVQLQRAIHLIFQKTESNSFDEFVDRYVQGQNLLETLRTQQILVDSRLAQLRAEHADLYHVWSDISFLVDESKKSLSNDIPDVDTSETNDGNNNDRYLDNQLFSKEVRLHHYQRLYDKSVHIVSEVRTAIAHLINILEINNKLLSGLPRSTPPPLNTDEDMAACLSWCEDRLIALNEALTMDTNRPAPSANEENKPIALRQTELAALVQDMILDKKNRSNGPIKSHKKQIGGLSKVLISSVDSSTFISSPRGVLVAPSSKVDKIYDSKVSKLQTERDKHSDVYDGMNFFTRENKSNNEVQRFLNEGLNKSFTKSESRKAKLLVNKRPGRTASYGLVLEELMQSRGQVFNLHTNILKSKQKDDSEKNND